MNGENSHFLRKICFILVSVFLIVAVAVFTNIRGRTLIQYNENVNRFILDFAETSKITQKLINLEQAYATNPDIEAMIPEYIGYANRLEYLNAYMQHAIHVILFFFFTLGFLYLFGFTKLSTRAKIILVILLGVAGSYASEMYQNSIDVRGYETIDIIHNHVGIAFAVAVFIFYRAVKYIFYQSKKKKNNQSQEVIIQYLSGENFFR